MNKNKVMIILMVLIMSITVISCNSTQKSTISENNETSIPVEYTINIVDLDTHAPIEKAYVSVLEVKKKYLIEVSSNKIVLPAIENSDLSKYPYGYSMITIAEGYLPRIDHSFIAAFGAITLELKKIPTEPNNEAYTEFFHGAAMNEAAGVLEYYEELPVENE